jgi:hypothetical protein
MQDSGQGRDHSKVTVYVLVRTVVATVMNLKKNMFAKRKPFRQATFLFVFIIFLKLKYIQITRVQFSQKSRANQQLSGHQSPRAYQLA